jgi:hypothetical protein
VPQAKRNYETRRLPATYKTSAQRVQELFATIWSGTLMVLRWCAALPGQLWALRKWSRSDWAEWWAGIKKTVKHEAHHYWVRRLPLSPPHLPATQAVPRVCLAEGLARVLKGAQAGVGDGSGVWRHQHHVRGGAARHQHVHPHSSPHKPRLEVGPSIPCRSTCCCCVP